MFKRIGLSAFFVLLLSIAAISSAADIYWNNGASNGNWIDGNNWTGGVVPNSTGDYARISMSAGPVFSSGQTVTAYRVYLQGTNGTLTMNGGTLNTNSHIYAAATSTDTATLNMSSGAINITTTFYIARDACSVATINLSGGTISCNSLIISLNGGTGGKINITGSGTLIINGDVIATITTYVNNGWITAYNGSGTVMRDYNITTPGKTTVWASSAVIASNPSPANGATNVPTTGTILSWTGDPLATSRNVYFGTSNPPAYIGNQTATTYNPGTLALNTTYYWRIDEVEDPNHINTGNVWSFTTQGSLIIKGPYLIYPGNNTQMTVLWQLSSTIGCTLAWGLDANCTTGSTATTEYGSDHQHKYTITGLTPGTKYYYQITAGSAQASGSFKSAPASDATKVKFFAYGDTRTYPADHNSVCSAINSVISGDPDFQTMLIHTGDWVEADAETNWSNEFFNRAYPGQLQTQATLPIQGTVGNHEGSGVYFSKYWPYTYVAGKYWSFDYGPAHIAVIDQYSSDYSNPNSPQLVWLANDLNTTPKKWKFIVLHEPGWSDSLGGSGGGHDNNLQVQANIEPICEKYGVQIVFCGHNHYYCRALVNNVHHITSGGGGAPLYNLGNGINVVTATKTYDFCKIIIDGNSLSFQAVQPNGTILDTFYIDKQSPEFTFTQVTDVQIGMEASQNCPGQVGRWQQAVSKINCLKPTFVIDTGDHVQNWSDTASLNNYINTAANIKSGIPLYHIPGNHDIGDTPTASRYSQFLAVFPNPFPASSSSTVPWYSFSYGDTLFICLDSMVLKDPSSFSGEDTVEVNWLTGVLQNSGQYAHKIVFMHIAPCLVSINEADQTFNMPSVPGNGRAYSNIRATLLNLFHQYGVTAVFDGHYHVPAYVNDNGLEIVTTESTTCPLGSLDVNTCGIQIVDIYPDHIEHTYRTLGSICPIPYIPGDFNGDGIVDMKDVAIFTTHWLDNGIWP